MLDEVRIISVNTSLATLLGRRPGRHGEIRDVYSGIRKSPVLGGTDLYLGPEGLEDLAGHRIDQQADTRVLGGKRVHGGPLKAVYAYPDAHYERWAHELHTVLVPGDFGENLTIDGVTEDDVVLGELWKWGDAILRVTGPRRPCYKLDMARGKGTALLMQQTGRCGWYFSVVKTGRVPTRGNISILHRKPGGITIARAFREKIDRDPSIPDMPEN